MMILKNTKTGTTECDCHNKPTIVERTYVEHTVTDCYLPCDCENSKLPSAAERRIETQIQYFDRGTLDEDGSVEWEIKREEIENFGTEETHYAENCEECAEAADDLTWSAADEERETMVTDETYTYLCAACGKVKEVEVYEGGIAVGQ